MRIRAGFCKTFFLFFRRFTRLYVDKIFRVSRRFGHVRQTLVATVIVLQLFERLKIEIMRPGVIHKI